METSAESSNQSPQTPVLSNSFVCSGSSHLKLKTNKKNSSLELFWGISQVPSRFPALFHSSFHSSQASMPLLHWNQSCQGHWESQGHLSLTLWPSFLTGVVLGTTSSSKALYSLSFNDSFTPTSLASPSHTLCWLLLLARLILAKMLTWLSNSASSSTHLHLFQADVPRDQHLSMISTCR